MLGKSHKELLAQPRERERIWTTEANVLAYSLRGQGCVVSLQREPAHKQLFFSFLHYSHFHTVLQLMTNQDNSTTRLNLCDRV